MPIAFSRRMRASARMQAVICIGYTLLLFACQLSVWGGMKLSARSGFDILPLLTWWSVPLLASIGLTLLALGAWSMKRRLVPAKRPRPLQTCSVSCAACAALLLGYGLLVFSPPASPPFACAGGLVLGWGAGMLLMEWAAVYARMAPDKATPSVLAALVAEAPSCASSWGLCPRPSSKPPLLRRPSCRPACSPTRKGLVHCGTCRASPSSRHRLAKRLLRGRGPGEEAARLRKTEPLREAKPADGRIRHRKTP